MKRVGWWKGVTAVLLTLWAFGSSPSRAADAQEIKGEIREIQTLVDKNSLVRVIVMLKGNEFTSPEFRDDAKKMAEVQKIQDDVLAILTTDDFQASRRYRTIPGFAGLVSKSGLEKLLKNQEVVSISLDSLDRAMPVSPVSVTSPSNPQGNSGIMVNVVCIDKIYEKPCIVGGIIVKTTEGKEVIRQGAGSKTFKIPLEPGDYLVVPLPGTSEYPVINFEPQRVRVKTEQFTELKFSYWDGRR